MGGMKRPHRIPTTAENDGSEPKERGNDNTTSLEGMETYESNLKLQASTRGDIIMSFNQLNNKLPALMEEEACDSAHLHAEVR